MKVINPEQNNFYTTVSGNVGYIEYGQLPAWDMNADATKGFVIPLPVTGILTGLWIGIHRDDGLLSHFVPTPHPATGVIDLWVSTIAWNTITMLRLPGGFFATDANYNDPVISRGRWQIWYILP